MQDGDSSHFHFVNPNLDIFPGSRIIGDTGGGTGTFFNFSRETGSESVFRKQNPRSRRSSNTDPDPCTA